MFNRLALRGKLILCYSTLVIISVLISLSIFYTVSNHNRNTIIMDIISDSAKSDNNTYDMILTELSDVSKTIIGNKLIQNALTDQNWNNDVNATAFLNESMNFNSYISSVYLFRNDGMRYYCDKHALKQFTYADITGASFYPQVRERNGGYVILHNMGGLVQDNSVEYLTFARLVRDLTNLQPIGILFINVEIKKILNAGDNNIDIYNSDDTMYVLVCPDGCHLSRSELTNAFAQGDTFSDIMNGHTGSFIVYGIKNAGLRMYFVKCVPLAMVRIPTSTLTGIISIIIVINGLLIIAGSLGISSFITKPLKKLIVSMQGVYEGHFDAVNLVSTKDEIGNLQEVYNLMIKEIDRQFQTILEEHRSLRHAEQQILMAQIKPHFLYNTLDSINALAVLGKIPEVTKTIKALSNFYSCSLNNGNEWVTIKTELQTLKAYLYIQQMRYQDLFKVEYSIAPDALEIYIPKMILQPLVENSIYHGIRGVVVDGVIKIYISMENTQLTIRVLDNGKGIKAEKIEEIKQGNSVGIGATMKRLSHYYGASCVFDIESEPGRGTAIIIKINRGPNDG